MEGLPKGTYVSCNFSNGGFSSERCLDFSSQIWPEDGIITDHRNIYVKEGRRYRELRLDEESGKGLVRSSTKGDPTREITILRISNNLNHGTTAVTVPRDYVVRV